MDVTFETLPKAVSSLFEKLTNIEKLLGAQGSTDQDRPDEILTVPQAAEFLSLSVPTIYSLISRRELPAMRKNGRVYFFRTELMNYLRSGRSKTVKELEAEATAYLSGNAGNKKGPR